MDRRKFLNISAGAAVATGVAGMLPGCAAAAGAQRAAATSASDPVHIKLSEEAGTPLKMRFLGTGAADWNGRDERGELRRLSSVLLDSKVLIDFTPTDEDMIGIRERYLHDYYVKTGNELMAVKMERAYNHRKDSIDQSREHMRSTDIMTRLALDTLTLHNQLRIKEKNEEISHNRLIWALVAGGMLLVALGLLAWTLYLRKRNADKQLEIINLKISNNRNVIAPHFIFNVLKQASIQQGKEADNSIEGIIKLMRSQIAVSRKVFVTLGEELEFTKNYVNLAKDSLEGDFIFTINKSDDPSTDRRLVPSTFVQILAENAIKHALREVEGEKRLTIDIEDTPSQTSISISDNGHGFDIRSRAAGTGTGLSVIRRTLALYNESHRHKITFNIENRTDDDGRITGCTVHMVVPTDVEQPS